MSKPQDEENQFKVLKNRANVKKERENEPKYKQLFLEVLEKHKGILTSATPSKNVQDYEVEKKTLSKIMAIERDAVTGAIAVGLAAFLTVRYLPNFAVRIIGGKAKSKALQEAEVRSRQSPNATLKSIGGFLFEGTFGFWAAYRGYHMAVSLRSEDVYDDIVNLPLCEGKSIVSDSICGEFSDLIKYKIHPDFWKNLDAKNDGAQKLNQEDFFRGVLQFEESCKKRRVMENMLKQRDGLSENESVYIPSPGVPKELTEDEIERMLKQT